MIKCFSNVIGHKEAQEIVIDLNQMISEGSETFYIDYIKSDTPNDSFTIVGNVIEKDWDELNLASDFMEVDIL
jgi:hypothetical protein